MNEIYQPSTPESIPSTTEQTLDARWFEAFQAQKPINILKGFEAPGELRNQQKEAFESLSTNNPELHYPNLDIATLRANERKLLVLKGVIKDEETNEDIKNIYTWKINETIARTKMMQCAALIDMYSQKEGELTEEDKKDREQLARRFRKYSAFCYGLPSQEIINYSANKFKPLVEQGQQSEVPDIKDAALRLGNIFANFSEGAMPEGIDPETYQLLHNHTYEVQGSLIDIPEFDGKVGKVGIKRYFEAAMQAMGATEKGWQVINDDADKLVVTVQNEAVYVPPKFKLSWDRIRELIVHEIGTHVTREINGKESQLQLLSMGLDRTEAGEEGLAVAREASVHPYSENTDYLGLERHLAIGLALGKDGYTMRRADSTSSEPRIGRDFRQTYAAMYDLYLLQEFAKANDLEKAHAEAQKKTWLLCVRIFRGTDCKEPGVCFTKDIAYAEGNVSTWYALQQNHDLVQIMLNGSFDIANPRHVDIVLRYSARPDPELQ